MEAISGYAKRQQGRGRSATVHFRVSPAWDAVVREAIEFDRAACTPEFFDRAVLHYLKKIGFEKPLPKR